MRTLSHIVAFHAQQSIEKVFKAILEEHNMEMPKIHNLVTLYGKVEALTGEGIEVIYEPDSLSKKREPSPFVKNHE